jgi:hypothetical protein
MTEEFTPIKDQLKTFEEWDKLNESRNASQPTVGEEDKWEKLDYQNITPEQMVALKECVKILKEMGLGHAAHDIAIRTGMEIIPEFPLDESPFARFLQESGLPFNVQGFIHDDENNIKYPMLGIFNDVRNFDKAFNEYIEKRKKKWFGWL